MSTQDAMSAITDKFTEVSRNVEHLSDAELLARCNRLIPARMAAADLKSAANALAAVAAFAMFLTTEIEKRGKP